ncbi:regulatory protein RecX [Microcella humidisoli]|uniref:Regulatory protein RecX n=1 Tax=Microcella humidisoli TaxID=2963406 RepID=A0ABY5FUS9_9MICO|nr:regulatory protein RecX [Microcella humidisoli]UTT62065.1 recombination regulator RecX [Microcella humidisoli]
MPASRGPGQSADGVDEPQSGAIAPVTFLPGAREAQAERDAADAAESAASHEADARRAENVTMHALTRRGQSRAEVADLLRRREIDPHVAEAELDRLESVGLIDDRALAADLVDRLRTRKKLGDSALRSELMRRKLDRSAIDEALAGGVDDDANDDLVFELARDRARRLGGLDRSTAERRLVDFLARKGHSGSAVREAARRALDDRDDELAGDASGAPARLATVHRVEFR